jgi:hypothetical protein
MFKTLLAWLGALGMVVLAARLIVSAVDAPTNGEEAIANLGAFASCCCGLGLFVLGLALRPTATTRVHTKTRQHAFTNRLSTEDAGSAMVVDFTSGEKGGATANKLSAALAEHYGTFGMGYEARVVGEERASQTGENTVVNMGTYHVAPNTEITVRKEEEGATTSEHPDAFWSEKPANALEERISKARNLNVLKAAKWTAADPDMYGPDAMETSINNWTLVFGTLEERSVLWFDAPQEVLDEWTERLDELARYREGLLEILLDEGDEHATAVRTHLDMTLADILNSEGSGDKQTPTSQPYITFDDEEDESL